MPLPKTNLVRQNDTCRLIPSMYSDGGASVLARVASDDDLAAVFELDDATNERLQGEANLLPGIGLSELVDEVPFHRTINAAFCHAHPLGSRFNGAERGAWYAGFELETAQREVAYHKARALADIDRFEDEVTYDLYLADFSAEFHDIRGDDSFAECLDPDSYIASQALAEQLLAQRSLGVVYRSVRQLGGTCVVCFRPALVMNVRKSETFMFTWHGKPDPVIERA